MSKKNRSKQFARYQRDRHIKRKLNIIRKSWCDAKDVEASSWFHEGRLSKGKIHCSCWMCSFHERTMQDRRADEKARYELEELKKEEADAVYGI